jgi:hypothetical protein
MNTLHILHIDQIENEEIAKLHSLEDVTFLLVNRARQERRAKLKTKTKSQGDKQ